MSQSKIDGTTRLTGIIGYPVEHSLSPLIHNAAFQALNLNWCYLPLPVKKTELAAALQGIAALNFVGVNITMPHKEAAIAFLDEVGSYARIVGAVNTIRVEGGRLVGFNTDGRGFITALERDARFDAKEKHAIIVGAGGAARAVAVSLSLSEVKRLTIVNRTLKRAQELYQLVSQHFPSLHVEPLALADDLTKAFDAAHIIINTTPVGMAPHLNETPFPVELIKSSHLVCDLIYYPRETLLLRRAREKEAQTLDGSGMLLYQAAASFEIWTGKEAPVELMRTVLEEHLRAEGKEQVL